MNPPSIRNENVGIGVAGVGARMKHVLGLLQARAPEIRVVAAYDPDPRALATAREIFGGSVRAHSDYAHMVADPAVEWVFIGSWNCFHAEQVIAALGAGKHVFCEKPLAISAEDVAPIRAALLGSGRQFAFGLVLRYSPLHREVRRLLEEGRIGEIISFEFNETLHPEHGGYIHGDWRRHRRHSGTFLLEKCCHDIDLSIWFSERLPVRVASFGGLNFFVPGQARQVARIGPDKDGRPAYRTWPHPTGVDPFGGGQDIFDNQVTILEYAGGIRASFHTSCHAAIQERRFYILGTEGALRADARTGLIEVARTGHGERTERIETGCTDGHSGGDEIMADHLVETLLNGRPPAAGLSEAIHSLVACGGIDRACDEQRVVDLAPTWAALGIDPSAPTSIMRMPRKTPEPELRQP